MDIPVTDFPNVYDITNYRSSEGTFAEPIYLKIYLETYRHFNSADLKINQNREHADRKL